MAGRPGFAEWVSRQVAPDEWTLLPLTHIARGLVACDIIRDGRVTPMHCDVLEGSFAFFFYGRPAYRLETGKVVKLEASCPHCFIFRGELIKRSNRVYAFDTGAFGARFYKHVLDDEFKVEDFQIGSDFSLPNKLIRVAFGSQESYFSGDRSHLSDPSDAAAAYEMEARSYLELLSSPGRNEPDDRICSIEVAFADPVPLSGELLGVVIPHTLWRSDNPSPLLIELSDAGVDVIPYEFIPNRHPEHYHTLLEAAVRGYYEQKGYLSGTFG